MIRNLGDLASAIGVVGPVNKDDRVMVMDSANGMLYNVTEVKSEVHDDADGSTTVWIMVEEH